MCTRGLSGVADYLAEDDAHALALARRAVGRLNRAKPRPCNGKLQEEPAYDPANVGCGARRFAHALRHPRGDCRLVMARALTNSSPLW